MSKKVKFLSLLFWITAFLNCFLAISDLLYACFYKSQLHTELLVWSMVSSIYIYVLKDTVSKLEKEKEVD